MVWEHFASNVTILKSYRKLTTAAHRNLRDSRSKDLLLTKRNPIVGLSVVREVRGPSMGNIVHPVYDVTFICSIGKLNRRILDDLETIR